MTLPPSPARLRDAINDHDPQRVAQAFTADYECVKPMHPSGGFTGSDQVLANRQSILARVPDISATVLRWTLDGAATWSEWEMRGTDTDGSPALLRGVVIATADGNGPIRRTRFYLDPVVDD